jgi:hypothetical protein
VRFSVSWAVCHAAAELAAATTAAFEQHADVVIITSFPDLGALTGARVFGELGMTEAASPTRGHSRPMRVPRPSPAPVARAWPCWSAR